MRIADLLAAPLVRRFRALASMAVKRAQDNPVLVWTSAPVEEIPWFLPREPGWLWRSPRSHVCAAGQAWAASGAPEATAQAWGSVRENCVTEGPLGPMAFCGIAFDPSTTPTGPWTGFPPSMVSVPRVLWLRTRGRSYAALSCLASSETLPREIEQTLQLAEQGCWADARFRFARARVAAEHPPSDVWKTGVAQAESLCRTGPLQKVVLARSVELETSSSAWQVIRRLWTRYPTCTVFAASYGGATFLGATPERLALVRGRHLLTEALAGTAPRGHMPEQDDLLRRQLEESPKQRWEHQLVADHVRTAMHRLCERVWEGRREVVVLPNVQHLRTRFVGRLHGLVDPLTVAFALHPTPAVAGSPLHLARAWLREHERLERGWYGGVVGWVGVGTAELVVAIRSALLRADRAWAFAGCGIVAGSDPEAEYAESQAKLLPLLEALGAEVP